MNRKKPVQTGFKFRKIDSNPLEKAEAENTETKRITVEIEKITQKSDLKAQELHKKALDQDKNVFDYDKVYDELKKQEMYKKQLKDGGQVKKARYMEDLIKGFYYFIKPLKKEN